MPAVKPARIEAPTKAQIGRRLRVARVRMGLSIGDATKYLRTTRQTIYSWERGFTTPPVDVYLQMLALYGADGPI